MVRNSVGVAALVLLAAVAWGTAEAGITYTWNPASNGLWATAANWTPAGGPPVSGDTALFNGTTTKTITDADGDACDVLSVTNSGVWTWAGPSLTVNSSFSYNGSGSSLLKTTLAGNGSLLMANGILAVYSNNTYTGGTTLNGGALNLNHAGALGAGGTFTINGGTVGATVATTLDGRCPQAWNGDFSLGGNQDFNLGTNTVTLSGSRAVKFGANAVKYTVGGVISGSGYTLTLTNQGANTGTLTLTNTVDLGSGGINVNASTLALGGSNAFTGGVTLNPGGGLYLNHPHALGNGGTLTINGGDLGATVATTLDGQCPIKWNGSFGIASGTSQPLHLGTNTVTMNGNVTVNVKPSSIKLSVGGVVQGAGYNLTVTNAASTLTFSNKVNVSQLILAPSTLTTVSLFASNSISGGVTVNGGVLQLSHASALGDNTLTMNGGTLQGSAVSLDGRAPQAWNGDFQLYGVTAGSYFNLGTNTITLGGNRLVKLGGVNQTASIAGVIQGSGYNLAITNGSGLGSATTLVLSNTVNTGSGQFMVSGPLTIVQLCASNNFSGITTNLVGTLKLSHALALQNSTYASVGGNLVFDSSVSPRAFTFGGLGGSANLALTNSATVTNDVTLSVGNNNQDSAYSGVLRGAGGLVKVGTGTLTLSGASTNTGATVVSNGTLLVDGSLRSSVRVAGGGTLGGVGTCGIVTNFGALAAAGTNAIGTLTVSNLVMESGSVAVFELGGAGIGDQVATSNLTFAAGSTVKVTPKTGFPDSVPYTLFTFSTLSGDLPTVLPIQGGYSASLSVVGNTVVLSAGKSGMLIMVK